MTEQAGIPIQLKIVSTFKHPGTKMTQEYHRATGSMYYKQQKRFLRFEEVTEEITKTLVKFEGSGGYIRRRGVADMRIEFELGQKTKGHYTMHGHTMPLEVFTSRIIHTEGHDRIEYSLYQDSEKMGDYTIDYHYTEVTE
ncbi:DUF1934 domain-containing protein [Chryseomicrobium palamuruense]